MNRKMFLSPLFLVTGLVIGYMVWGVPDAPTPVEAPAQKQTAGVFQLMVDYNDDKTLTVINDAAFSDGHTVLQAVIAALAAKEITVETKEYKGIGTMVTKIGPVQNGETKYWQYWVNGRYPAVGADQYLLKSGDVVEWKFTGARM
ncbi:DUF4430 domain-containing protein [Candidatus Uhrbacteria bacterium]|nr:DUF4430 domain-containing protein [Candidatus Uhrbacteria bacterium]